MEKKLNQWLEEKGFGQYTKLFNENGITIDDLPKITTHNDLKSIGIKSFVHRRKILFEITVFSSHSPKEAGQPSKPSSHNKPGKVQQKGSSSSHKSTTEKIQRLKPSSPHMAGDESRSTKRNLKKKIELLEKDTEDVAGVFYDLGMNYYMNNQYDEAIVNHKKALQIRIKLSGEDNDEVAVCYHQIGLDYYHYKKYKQAITNCKKAIGILLNFYKEENEHIATVYYDLAWCYYLDDTYDKAIVNHKKALDIRIKTLGEEHEDVANCYYQLGFNYYHKSQYDQSIANHKKALEIRLKIFGEEHEDVARSYYQLGFNYYLDDQNKQAIVNHKKALATQINLTGEKNEDVAKSYYQLGMDYYYENLYKQAIANHKKALVIRIKLFGEEHEDVADCYHQLGLDYRFNNQFGLAIANHKKALELRIILFGEEHEEVIALKKTITDYHTENNESEEIADNVSHKIVRRVSNKTYRKTKKTQSATNIHFVIKFISSLLLSIATIVLFTFIFSFQIFNTPEFEYDTDWFITAKSGYLTWGSTNEEDESQVFKKKTSLTPGIQLKPIAKQNAFWIQAETPRGQRGFVHYTLFTGAKYVEAKGDIVVTNKIGDKNGDTITTGTKASIIKRFTETNNSSETNFVKIKFEDGRTRWAKDNDLKKLIFNDIPNINKKYYYPTSIDIVEQNIIGSSLDEIELHYGIATSYIKGIGKNQAYFGNLIVVDQKNHYKGIMVFLTKQDTATGFEYIAQPVTRIYDYLPFINSIRKLEVYSLHHSNSNTIKFIRDKKLEPSRLFGFLFYHHDGNNSNWWTRFINNNWFTMTIGWIVNVIMFIIVIGIIFSIPRLIVAPIMQLVAHIHQLGLRYIRIINFLIFLVATYIFLLIMVIVMDQFFMPALASSLVFYYWWKLIVIKLTNNMG